MSDQLDADVIVVGCGPVGVMTALRCAQRGVRVLALDQTPDIYPLPRAIGMDDEIQRLFSDAGLGAELRACSTPLHGAEFLNAAGERVVGFELPNGTVGPLGHPPVVMFDQPQLEASLRDGAAGAGVELRYGLEAVGVDDGPADHLSLEVRAGDRAETLRARWLVGADGARSTIRGLLDIALEDQGFDQPWLVVDTTLLDPDLPLSTLATQYCEPSRVVTFVPGHDTRRRWEFRLDDSEQPDDVVDPDFIAGLLSRWGTTEQLRIDRAAYYRFHATVAETFRCGRVFLAGDAAHQMPPFNGQGMCTGMRDAENLSWKLAAVMDGHGGDPLLDSYDQERRPHAAGQVAHSADAGRLIDAIAAGDADQLDAGYGGGRPFPHLESGLVTGDHPAVGRPLPDPGVPLAQGWLVLHALPVPPDLGGLWSRISATPVAVDPSVQGAGSFTVVRPDRLVAAVTDDLTVLAADFAPLFGT